MPMDSDLLSERPGFYPVCLDNDEVNEDAFDGTPGLHNDLEKEVGHDTAGDLLDGIEQDQVRETLLPDFLLPARERMETNQELVQMQRLKEAAREHVRWRSYRLDTEDLDVAAVASAMRALARSREQDDSVCNLSLVRGTCAPGSARAAQADFLAQANKRSLGVLALRSNATLRDEYRVLLQALPAITLRKVGGAQLATLDGKAIAIGQLVAKHSGEIVELDQRRTSWTLQPVAPGSASADLPEQWYCCANRAAAGQADRDFGWPGLVGFELLVDVKIR